MANEAFPGKGPLPGTGADGNAGGTGTTGTAGTAGREDALGAHIDKLTITDQDGRIGERIDLARRLSGLRPGDLAVQAGLSPEQLAAFGRGTGSIPLRAFLRLAAVLGVTAEWLCGPVRAAHDVTAAAAHWELERLHQALEGRSDSERKLLVGFVRDIARRFHLASRDLSARTALRAQAEKQGERRAEATAEIVRLAVPSPSSAPPAQDGAARTAGQAGSAAAPRVLVVDDSADVLVALGAFVESAGYEAVRAASADEGVAKLSSDPLIVAVVTDYAMPDVSGVELLAQVATIRPGLPAMIVTGFPDLAALTKLPQPVEVLRKPFRRQEFVSRLHALVNAAVGTAAGATVESVGR